jgi:hypothetical protein
MVQTLAELGNQAGISTKEAGEPMSPNIPACLFVWTLSYVLHPERVCRLKRKEPGRLSPLRKIPPPQRRAVRRLGVSPTYVLGDELDTDIDIFPSHGVTLTAPVFVDVLQLNRRLRAPEHDIVQQLPEAGILGRVLVYKTS